MLEANSMNTDLPLTQSLKELQDAAERIFATISKRVSSQHQQVKGLSERIVSAQAKVDAISGTKRATTIYSSAKYPRADPSVADFVPLFGGTAQNGYKAPADTVPLDTGQWQSQEEGTVELFQFFSETSHEYWLKDHKHKDGVGKVPPGIKSVADLLLFNSTEFPYHKYNVVDNLVGSEQLIVQEDLDVRPAALPAAPQSVLAGEVLPRPEGDEFGFRPVLRQIPSFSLPPVLPDLPMVAEISWSGVSGGIDQLPSIAPSAVHGGLYSPRSNYSASPRFDTASAFSRFDPASVSARPASAPENGSSQREKCISSSKALPSLNMSPTRVEKAEQSKATSSGSGTSSTGSSSSATNLPSLPSLSLAPQSLTLDAPRAPTPRVAPPPPPPPTPPSRPPQSSPAKGSSSGRKSSSALPTLPPVDSQRAALMASIRSSGLDLLRKTPRSPNLRSLPETSETPEVGRTDVEVPEKLPEKIITPSEPKQPMNLMAEMAKSLTLRRLSMQGTSPVQGSMKSDTQTPSRNEGQKNTESGQTSALKLPNLGAFTEQNEDQSDDDDDDDEWD